jgi:ssDNA-binding Zn-finger/Zn-ribbon topoisomerase 1
MNKKIVKFPEVIQPYAACPKCKETQFHILLNKFGLEWTHIQGFECVDCAEIIWININKERQKEQNET